MTPLATSSVAGSVGATVVVWRVLWKCARCFFECYGNVGATGEVWGATDVFGLLWRCSGRCEIVGAAGEVWGMMHRCGGAL